MGNTKVIKRIKSSYKRVKEVLPKPEIVISDFDGTIADTTATAISRIREILSLIGHNESVSSFSDYWRYFGKKSVLRNVTSEQTALFREMHRVMMHSDAEKIELFDDVMSTYRQLKKRPLIVSSSYSSTVTKALGNTSTVFEKIYGFNDGRKMEILRQLRIGDKYIYVTDTRIDIERCKSIEVPVIGVGWGFDSKKTLLNASPDFFASDFNELKRILGSLNLLKN